MVEWRVVVGFPLYEVNRRCEVRRIKPKQLRHKNGRYARRKLKPRKCSKGYFRVDLYRGNEKKTIRIHTIGATAFIPNPEQKDTVNHKDLDQTNNNISNLEWMTNIENIKHSYHHGKSKRNYKPHYANY